MARQSTAAQRNLTLTEELERIEQSITLTLQGMNPPTRAHRIVTTSILPIVDQYAEHSKNVWEGSKFWKQFFEASANVSLSGYEEPLAEDQTATVDETTTATTPSTSIYSSPSQEEGPNATPRPSGGAYIDSLSPSPAQSTPRPANKQAKSPKQKQKQQPPTTAPYSSPYDTLKRDLLSHSQSSPSDSTPPSTPRPHNASPHLLNDPLSSPFAPPSTSVRTAHRTPANDILLHRVLDKKWRLQATPHSTARTLPYRSGSSAADRTPKLSIAKRDRFAAAQDNDLDSSPAIAVPELHAEIFGSPARSGRVPGVSVLTPAKGKKEGGGGRGEGTYKSGERENNTLWDSDSDDEELDAAGMSPPKTIQFHVPQGRLIRTPAREASKRIVEDILLTAGGNVTDDLDEEDSPSVVKRRGLLDDDDTF
ncbi:MAG: hypothetical protein Q9163_004033 [Psora crenata]